MAGLTAPICQWHKTQMGTIIADSSHFAAFHRSVLLRQATVISAGFLPLMISLQSSS
jgi:hypothetical protein